MTLRFPGNDLGRKLDHDNVYLLFETNEGDTPRILSSQFTSAWLSPNRGSVPIGWALDPLLGEMFPDLWNFYMESATINDTFVSAGGGFALVSGRSLMRVVPVALVCSVVCMRPLYVSTRVLNCDFLTK